MTKLYHNAAEWQIPGQQDRKAARVDVPGSPAELAAWLNERGVRPIAASFAGLAIVEDPELEADEIRLVAPPAPIDTAERRNRCPECKALLIATEAGADTAAIGRTVDRISNWMATAPDWALNRISENMAAIADELRNRGRAN